MPEQTIVSPYEECLPESIFVSRVLKFFIVCPAFRLISKFETDLKYVVSYKRDFNTVRLDEKVLCQAISSKYCQTLNRSPAVEMKHECTNAFWYFKNGSDVLFFLIIENALDLGFSPCLVPASVCSYKHSA